MIIVNDERPDFEIFILNFENGKIKVGIFSFILWVSLA